MNNNQKGFAHLLLLILISTIIFLGIGYYAYQKGQIDTIPSKESDKSSTAPPSGSTTSTWKVYSSKIGGYTIEYPANWESFQSSQSNSNDGYLQISSIKEGEMGNLIIRINNNITYPVKDWVSKQQSKARGSDSKLGPYIPPEYIGENKLQDYNSSMYLASGTGIDTGKYINYVIKRQNNTYVISIEIIGNYRNPDDFLNSQSASSKIYNQILSTLKFSGTEKAVIASSECLQRLTKSPLKNNDGNTSSISGNVYYPSEGLPPEILACAYNTENNFRYCTSSFSGQDHNFTLKVPAGNYYVYTITSGGHIGVGAPNTWNDYQSFYNENGVLLGQAPLKVQVKTNSDVTGIGIGDDILLDDNLYCLSLLQ